MTRGCRLRCLWSLLLMLAGPLWAAAGHAAADDAALVELGRALFHDTALSSERSVSCASCHAPARAWSDARSAAVDGAVSAGVGGRTGLRNAPSLGYVALVPALQQQADAAYVGGLFWDGRSNTLAEQVAGPLFNAAEMGLAGPAALLQRLQENPAYTQAFSALFGADSLRDAATALDATGTALAAYESSSEFLAFDSRYDRYLRGDYEPTRQEALGMALFFSPQFTNCSQCHQLQRLPHSARESFSNHRYENIGVPANPQLAAAAPDAGLGGSEGGAPGAAQQGRFRVPTLRNVAVSGPYMHNGVFKDLRTVLQFYNAYLQRGSTGSINPETGSAWGEPEVRANLALDKLRGGLALDERAIDALVSFMHMLTDSRFEQNISKPGIGKQQGSNQQLTSQRDYKRDYSE